MQVRDLILPGFAAAFAAAAPADAQSAGDAHVIRPVRGDIIIVQGEPKDERTGSGASPYVAPYRGWRYSAVRRGDRLRPGFYAARYVVADPRRHGLPVASGNRRWVRYGNDLLLVDRVTGRVLRAVRHRYSYDRSVTRAYAPANRGAGGAG